MSNKTLQLKVLFEGLDKLTGPLKNIANGSGKARAAIAATRGELGKLNDLQGTIRTFKNLETALNGTSDDIKTARQKVADLAATMAATDAPTKKLAQSYDKAQRDLKRLEDQHESAGRQLQNMSAKLSAAGIDVSDLASHEDRLANKVYEANAALKTQQDTLEKINRTERNKQDMEKLSGKLAVGGAAAVAGGVAIGTPLAAATKDAMTFESAMADVRKVVDFPNPQAFAKMSDDLLDLSTRIPMVPEGLAQIAAAAGRSGVVARSEILKFTEDAAKMGVAFDVSAEQAGGMMAKWRAAFGLNQNEVVALSDRVNALTNKFGGSADAVSDIVTRIGALGEVNGVTAPQVAAIGQLMNRLGVESEVAATGTKNMMLALTKGSSATKSQSEAFKALGLDAEQVAVAMQKDAAGAITDVMTRISRLDEAQRPAMLTELFGSESVAAIAPMLTKLDMLKENFRLVGDQAQYAGSMNKEFLARIATTEGATGLAGNALKSLNIKMGQGLLPTVSTAADKITTISNAMREWAEENPNLSRGLVIFAAVGAASLIVLGALGLAFAAITAAAAPLGIALGPLLLIIAAVAALAGAVYLIYSNWDGIVSFFTGIWAQIKQAFDGGLWGVLALLWQIGSLIIGALWTGITAVVGALPGILGALFSALKYIIWNGLLLLPRLFFQFGVNTIKGLIDGLFSMFPSLKGIANKIGSILPDGVRKRLDIHSPSRVFSEIGGHVMAGLDLGLAQNAGGPLARVSELSGQMTKAMAIGAGVPAMAMTAPAMAAAGVPGPHALSAAPTAATYNITIHADTKTAQDIAQQVRDAIEQIERERRGRGFGDD